MSKKTRQKLTKKQKRVLEQNFSNNDVGVKLNFELKQVQPLTLHQNKTFQAFENKKNLLLHGVAGTGKSFISIFLALRELMSQGTKYKKLIICKSVVPTRDIGFLPGTVEGKIEVYEDAYRQIFSELFNRADAYDYLKQKQIVEFMCTSFIRGITLNDCIVVVDEMQNCDWGELSSVITRVGENCRIVFCGDFRQSDLRFKERHSRDHIKTFMKIIDAMKEDFEFVEFDYNDIVRSKMVKRFIIESTRIGMDVT